MHGPHCRGKLGNCQRKVPVVKSLLEKEFGDHAKTKGKRWEIVCSNCKFPDSKEHRYCNACICHEISSESKCVCEVSSAFEIVANYCNWQWANLWSDRENTGKTHGI